jgi:hypothetical protein
MMKDPLRISFFPLSSEEEVPEVVPEAESEASFVDEEAVDDCDES